MTEIIRYVKAPDGVKIAYSSRGDGPPLIHLCAYPRSHLERELLNPRRRLFYDRLAAHHQLIRVDFRGTGLSDREIETVTLDSLVSDLVAVAEELRLTEFSVLASGISAIIAAALASSCTRPPSQLILWDPTLSPAPYTKAVHALTAIMDEAWEVFLEARFRMQMNEEEAHDAAELVKACTSPSYYKRARDMWAQIDPAGELAKVSCPTLVMHSRDREMSRDSVASTASLIAGARLAVVEGSSAEIFNSDIDEVLHAIDDFLGVEEAPLPAIKGDGSFIDLDFSMPAPELTPRELEIIQLLVEGLRSKEIGRRLGLSTHTVERHIANLYRKTGVNGRVALTVFALRHGMISEPNETVGESAGAD